MDHKEYIENLIVDGDIAKAIKELLRGVRAGSDDRMENEVISLSGRYNGLMNERRQGGMSDDFYTRSRAKILSALTGSLSDYKPPANIEFEGSADDGGDTNTGDTDKKPDTSSGSSGKPTVFISYSHSDSEVAQAMKAKLEEADVEVFIDADYLAAGGNIADFILDMIKRTDTTISLVSTRSLLSGWVGLESVTTLQHTQFKDDKQFIACAIDTDFFNDDFIDESLEKIIEKIDKYNERIKKRQDMSASMDTSDLEAKRNLQTKLLNNFPSIVNRLNQFYTVDISGEKFEGGVETVIKALKK